MLLVSSCVTQKQVEYLQLKKNQPSDFPNKSYEDYRLKPNDELYVNISSLDDVTTNIFTTQNNQNLGSLNAYGASLMSHSINKDGYLELPVIGRILAKDKTISEVTTIIKESLTNVLSQPVVSLKLVNRYISVLGEVRNPGHFVFAQDKLTLFDAIGLAGDITDYGNKRNVVLIRNNDSTNKRVELNLLKTDLLSSEYYFLKPGDIVYVKPMKNKFWGLRQFPFTVVLSSVTTSILILNYINSNYN